MHPQYSFISLQSFVRLTLHFIPLKALSFVSLHSSRIMSAALSFFSGCSFAQPSGLAPSRPKRRDFALNQGSPPRRVTYIFSPPFHASSKTLHCVNSVRSFSCCGCAIAATPPRRSSSAKKSAVPLKWGIPFFAPCGAWGC